MSKSAWDYTLEVLSLMGDIDYYNDLLSKNLNRKDREIYSKKVDSLESKFFFLKEKEVPSHTYLSGEKEKIVVWTRRCSSEVLPCREANDRKAKLPKFEQSVFKFLSYLPRTTVLCMENLCAEEPTRS